MNASLNRFLHRAAYVALCFGAFAMAVDIQITLNFLDCAIPPGRVMSMKSSKGFWTLAMDSGVEASVSTHPFFANNIELRTGDTLEKSRNSSVLKHNGKPITDTSWVVYELLISWPLRIPLVIYVLTSVIYAVGNKRWALRDVVSTPGARRESFIRAGIVFPSIAWIAATVGMIMVFGCITQVLGALIRPFLR